MRYQLSRKHLFYIFLLWFFVHSLVIIWDGLSKSVENYDIALILGTKVNRDGSLSERLIHRLDCGVELLKSNQVSFIVVSGGLGKEGYFEGTKMKEYLIKQGISETKISVDNLGNNTRRSAKNLKILQKKMKFNSVIVVSQYFHISRAKMLLRKENFKRIGGASPNYFEIRDIYSVFREFFGFYTQLF